MTDKKQFIIESNDAHRDVLYVLIFDVDGVLTHPSEKKVTELKIFSQLERRLKEGEPIILNTGRGIDFMLKKILEPLEEMIADKRLFINLFAIGEKGAVSVQYDAAGRRTEYVDESISVPENLQRESKKLVEEKFSDVAFYDITKKTMISIEMLDNLTVEKFRERQENLNNELARMLMQHGLTENFRVDPSRIATDVENKHVGKGLGVRKALRWLVEKKIKPGKFIAFGDSSSDTAMAEELQQRGLPVEFVFVGEKILLSGKKLTFPVTYTTGQCEVGTLEYLENL
ncbi:MAG: HAD hydrolase family protein [Parcubacteria group bacterium]|jgi:hydroxymethylpyrimidine pyrophosphatase-like HAD family hydrolase